MKNHFRAACPVCGLFVDSAYCKEVEGKGYECQGCKTTCKYDLNTIKPVEARAYFVRARHISGRKKDVAKRIHLSLMPIERFVELAGKYGWAITEYTPVDEGTKETILKV